MFGCGKSQSWGDDTLNGWIIGVIHEKHNTIHGTVNLEIGFEETSCFQVDTHCRENDDEIFFRVIKDIFSFNERCLSTDLGTNIVMG
jgi:hypothetical protein